MNELIALKDELYDLLDLDDEDPSKDSITQKMNVAISSAVQKQGITIIPIQNAVQKKIVVKVVNILKHVDRMMEGTRPVETVIALDYSTMCETWADKELKLEDILKDIRYAYLQTLMVRHKNNKTFVAKLADINVHSLRKYLNGREVMP